MSGVRLSRHYVRGMLARNWGRIVFVSSESGLQIPVEMIHYGTTKTAQLAVARGERRIATNEPKVWFTSTESFAKVLSAGNRELLRLIAEKAS